MSEYTWNEVNKDEWEMIEDSQAIASVKQAQNRWWEYRYNLPNMSGSGGMTGDIELVKTEIENIIEERKEIEKILSAPPRLRDIPSLVWHYITLPWIKLRSLIDNMRYQRAVNRIPILESVDEAVDYIISQLSPSDKEEMKKLHVIDLHFGMGMWIRNMMLYPKRQVKLMQIASKAEWEDKLNDPKHGEKWREIQNGYPNFNIYLSRDPDSVSQFILKEVQRKLRSTLNE